MWDTTGIADKYHIYRAESPDGKYEFVVSTEICVYYDTIPSNKTYHYKVKASIYCEEHEEHYYSKYVMPDPQLPTPKNFVAEAVSPKEIQLSWDEVNNATWYDVIYSELESEVASLRGNLINQSIWSSPVSAKLNPSTKYYFRVAATGLRWRLSQSEWSEIVSATTPDMYPAPSGIVVEALSDSEIRISWEAVEGAERYKIAITDTEFRYDWEGNLQSNFWWVPTTSPFTITNLKPSTEYHIKILAVINNFNGLPSEAFTATTYEKFPAPNGLVAEILPNNEVRLSWEAVEGAERYRIIDNWFGSCRTSATDTENSLRSPEFPTYRIIANTENLSYTITNLLADKNYCLEVAAVRGNSPGNWAEVSVLIPKEEGE